MSRKSGLNLQPTRQHLENAQLSRRGKKPPPPRRRKVKELEIHLEQDEDGNWLVVCQGSKKGLPATDYEVTLWRELQELRANLE